MKKKLKLNITAVNTCLLIGLLVILALSLYAIMQVQKGLVAPAKQAEPPKPAKLTVTVITPPDCDDCFDSSLFAQALKQLPNTEITENKITHNSTEAKKLIEKYKLTRLPAAVVTGELENTSIPGFNKTSDAYYFTDTPPPYYDISSKKIIGRVGVTYITDKTCTECFDTNQLTTQLKSIGVAIASTKTLDITDKEAKDMIQEYKITKVPTMLLTKDALAYDIISQVWKQIGTQETDGTLVMRTPTPPYRDLTTRKVRGLVTLTYLVDGTCATCYNVSLHKQVLEQSFGMKFAAEKTLDVSTDQGKKLVEKYNITQVPTILLDKEAEAYTTFTQTWDDVGTKETDGTYVFKKVNLLQGATYKDLSTSTIMNATTTE